MNCDHARDKLTEYADDVLPDRARVQVGEHLATCSDCQADYNTITELRALATGWHDEVPPSWQPPNVAPARAATLNLDWLRDWFPSLASATALVLVTVMFLREPEVLQVEPADPASVAFAQFSSNTPQLSPAGEASLVQNVLDSARQQRQQELAALMTVMKAEMDRRTLETEESLRYVITHQMQGQQEIDDLQRRLQRVSFPGGQM